MKFSTKIPDGVACSICVLAFLMFFTLLLCINYDTEKSAKYTSVQNTRHATLEHMSIRAQHSYANMSECGLDLLVSAIEQNADLIESMTNSNEVANVIICDSPTEFIGMYINETNTNEIISKGEYFRFTSTNDCIVLYDASNK